MLVPEEEVVVVAAEDDEEELVVDERVALLRVVFLLRVVPVPTALAPVPTGLEPTGAVVVAFVPESGIVMGVVKLLLDPEPATIPPLAGLMGTEAEDEVPVALALALALERTETALVFEELLPPVRVIMPV